MSPSMLEAGTSNLLQVYHMFVATFADFPSKQVPIYWIPG